MKYCTLLLTLLMPFLYACESTSTNQNAQQNTVSKAETDFKLIVEAPNSAEYNDIYELLKAEDVLEKFINGMNKRVEFPGEVAIKVTECGETNAFYHSETSTISICYEFLRRTMDLQDANLAPRDRLLNATAFMFLHEMGHALVDKLDLPITGKEENAVDELAMILLMSDTTDATYFAALEGAIQFYHDALEEDLSAFPYYDTHAPSLERYYDMLTIIVGSNPEAHTEFVGENDPFKLHPDRAESAAYEYDKKLSAWKTILGTAWRE